MTSMPRRRAFTLLELLIVIAIIAILLALLMPVIGAVRRTARSTRCLANLQQWGHAYQMYLNGNAGRSFAFGGMPAQADSGNNPLMWWELLRPAEAGAGPSLLCDEASEAANTTPRDAFQAWGPERFWDTPTQVRGPYVGSYGFNGWLYGAAAGSSRPAGAIRLPTPQSSRVPVIFDCARLDADPTDSDPPFLYGGGGARAAGSMRFAAIERHRQGINVLFVDGHAEHVPAPGLWALKWSDGFQARNVTIER